MRHTHGTAIRTVRFAPRRDVKAGIEVIDLATMRRRASSREFRGAQRLAFDILLRVERGATVHTVDLVAYDLGPSDTLWVHAGQVQQWGDIGAIDGPVALFTSSAVDLDTVGRIRATGMAMRSHFPAGPEATGQELAWAHLRHCAAIAAGETGALGAALMARSLAALLLELVVATATRPGLATRRPTEGFLRLRDAIEERFATERRVAAYAMRLGYSTRTLDRLARANAGVTAKELIDERVVLEAQRMLLHGDEAVGAIAATLGFDDASNFSRYFTRRAGTTPAAFRWRAGGRETP